MIPEARLQQLLGRKDAEEAAAWCAKHGYSEGWALIDGALVIYDCDNPPHRLVPVQEACDEDGYTVPAGEAGVAPATA